MANISSLLNTIKNAIYGRDMRSALHDSIEAVNYDVETRLHQSGGTMTGDIIMNNHKVTSSVIPSADNDYTNKKYVDDAIDAKSVTDVKVGGTSVTENGVANIPIASSSSPSIAGVVKVNTNLGLGTLAGSIAIVQATESQIDSRTNMRNPIVPSNLNYAVRSVYPITEYYFVSPFTCSLNTIYELGLQSNVEITMPTTEARQGAFIQVNFISGTIPTTLSVTSSVGISGFDLVPEANMVYSLYFDYGIIGYGTTETIIDGTVETEIAYTYGWKCTYSEAEVM